ncbi:hypothetical protein BJ742DRAFT_745813 [Cladochytrium replicatum]|nr:hypothetical protein BJ742DRAFT_745813 [Cladochytrium replicatum]
MVSTITGKIDSEQKITWRIDKPNCDKRAARGGIEVREQEMRQVRSDQEAASSEEQAGTSEERAGSRDKRGSKAREEVTGGSVSGKWRCGVMVCMWVLFGLPVCLGVAQKTTFHMPLSALQAAGFFMSVSAGKSGLEWLNLRLHLDLAAFSSCGPIPGIQREWSMDISAPSSVPSSVNSYTSFSGTSMASSVERTLSWNWTESSKGFVSSHHTAESVLLTTALVFETTSLDGASYSYHYYYNYHDNYDHNRRN